MKLKRLLQKAKGKITLSYQEWLEKEVDFCHKRISALEEIIDHKNLEIEQRKAEAERMWIEIERLDPDRSGWEPIPERPRLWVVS